jgi:hypothetical protein
VITINPIDMKSKFDLWLEKVNETRKEYWDNNYSYKEYEPLKVEKGRKYIKLINDNSVWGFVSMWDGVNKGVPVKKGDLMKPAGYNGVAKHSRGNIFDGTDSWEYFGPTYIR